jgi:hypothetical protein
MYRRIVLLERKNNEPTSMVTLLVAAHFFHLPLTSFDLLSSSINLL